MTENETTLIEKIMKHNNPEKALLVAIEIIADFLTHPESTELKSSADSQEHI